MKSEKILIIDDELDIRDLLSYNLAKKGYEVNVASSAKEALKLLKDNFSLLVLDVMMPNMDGYQLCKYIRTSNLPNKNIPIIFLTAKDTEMDEVFGFEIGADDFITKPISMYKLLARINALIRRDSYHTNHSNKLNWGKLQINKDDRTVLINKKLITLTKTEFDLLFVLLSRQNKVFHRQELLDIINKDNVIVTDRVVDVHIKKIRDKLLDYKNIIETVHGVGYIGRKSNIPEHS